MNTSSTLDVGDSGTRFEEVNARALGGDAIVRLGVSHAAWGTIKRKEARFPLPRFDRV